jgi:hypothetical protein
MLLINNKILVKIYDNKRGSKSEWDYLERIYKITFRIITEYSPADRSKLGTKRDILASKDHI